MRKFFQNFFSLFNLSGRDLPKFLLSLLLAFSIWLIHNLIQSYSDTISVPVTAHAAIEGHSGVSISRCNLTARVRTTGFGLIRLKLSQRSNRDINFDKIHRLDDEIFYVTAGEMQEYVPAIFGDNVRLEYCITDTLKFRFPRENYRKVPVILNSRISYEPQFQPVRFAVEPDSVLIYGEQDRLDRIEYVTTEHLDRKNVDSDVHGLVRLKKLEGVRFSTDNVKYSIDVVRFVELKTQKPVRVRGVPAGKSVAALPPYVNLSLHCVFPSESSVLDKVNVYVDYQDYASSRSGSCIVKIDSLPRGVISSYIDPQVVTCRIVE